MDHPNSPSDRVLRVGAVSYLNSKPLVYHLAALAPSIELSFDVPSRLSAGLAAGRLDVALVPSIDYLRQSHYMIVSDACIACRGPVLSVKLLSRRPPGEIRTLALDEGSRTSVVLARLLLRERYGLEPELQSLPIGAAVAECRADAVLVIGDRAIRPSAEGDFVDGWDLGEEWFRWSGLPFVFAMWIARRGTDLRDIATSLAAARDAGVAHLEAIAAQEAPGVGLSQEAALAYLRDRLHFFLGPEEQQGLELFRRCALRLGETLADGEGGA